MMEYRLLHFIPQPGTEHNETFQLEEGQKGQKGQERQERPDVRNQNLAELLLKGPEKTDVEKIQEKKEMEEQDPNMLAEKGAAEIQENAAKSLAKTEASMNKRVEAQNQAAKRGRISTDDSITEIAGMAATGAMAFGTEENFDTKENTNIEQSATTKIASTEAEKPEQPTSAQTSEQVTTESLAQNSQGGAGEEAKKTEAKQIFAEDAKNESTQEFFT